MIGGRNIFERPLDRFFWFTYISGPPWQFQTHTHTRTRGTRSLPIDTHMLVRVYVHGCMHVIWTWLCVCVCARIHATQTSMAAQTKQTWPQMNERLTAWRKRTHIWTDIDYVHSIGAIIAQLIQISTIVLLFCCRFDGIQLTSDSCIGYVPRLAIGHGDILWTASTSKWKQKSEFTSISTGETICRRIQLLFIFSNQLDGEMIAIVGTWVLDNLLYILVYTNLISLYG